MEQWIKGTKETKNEDIVKYKSDRYSLYIRNVIIVVIMLSFDIESFWKVHCKVSLQIKKLSAFISITEMHKYKFYTTYNKTHS